MSCDNQTSPLKLQMKRFVGGLAGINICEHQGQSGQTYGDNQVVSKLAGQLTYKGNPISKENLRLARHTDGKETGYEMDNVPVKVQFNGVVVTESQHQ